MAFHKLSDPLMLLFILLWTASAAFCQTTEITWEDLSDVEFEDVWDENAEINYQKPSFGESVKGLEGKNVAIIGYMIPVDINLGYYVLSAFPFASCFFCGGAGPESVLDLNFAQTQRFKNDENLKVCGTLRLNAADFYNLPFALDDAAPCL